jgi:O-antigen ligase
VIIVGSFLISARLGVLTTFLSKPIIDASWSYFFGAIMISPVRAAGVMVPILVFTRSLGKGIRVTKIPLLGVWVAYVGYSLFAYTFNIFEFGFVKFVELAFRALNGLVGYYMIQAYFTDRESFRKLLLCLIVAGFFPMFVGLYQAVTGVVWHQDITIGLERSSGLYHDIQTVRQYGFQTLTAIILYWCYFFRSGRDFLKKALILGFTMICLIVLYKTYSKAAIVILALWAAIWTVSRKQYVLLVVVVVSLVSVNLMLGDRLSLETEQLFSRELAATDKSVTQMTGDETRKRTLAGRWYIWEQHLGEYMDRPIIYMILGNGNPGASHNDFLATLLSTGIIGLILYCTLLFSIGLKVTVNYLRERTPLNVMAAMLFSMWMVDAMGLVPSLYPSYQWYVWGFIGLSFQGVRFDSPETGNN